jgi:DNA helicase HerA-like ATPase
MWTILGEEKGRIKLVSTIKADGKLPKGSFLTVEDKEKNQVHILRVTESLQNEPYSPSPMLADMDLRALRQDQKCQNIVYACKVADLVDRTDGLIDFIRPQLPARRSTQKEIDLSLGLKETGPKVFLATVQDSKNQILRDEQRAPIIVSLPPEIFFHQILICGKTGSGKTVASKYLAQYFVEEISNNGGAVLAVNVKDVDFLKMDKPSVTISQSISEEWKTLNQTPHGIGNFTVYYPANSAIDCNQGVNMDVCKRITLNVQTLDPEALSGLLVGVSDIAAQQLPSIFRSWQAAQNAKNKDYSFSDFVRYFEQGAQDKYNFATMNQRGDPGSVTLPWGTYHNILRNIEYAVEFFDNEGAENINAQDILARGTMSVINVTGERGIQFGSVILRHLLKNIVEEKSSGRSRVPILIIIDEVHQFYDTTSSREALGELDTICRTGRSKEIGVIFSSQNPSDIPKGLSNVINTKIFFKSDRSSAKDYDMAVTSEEIQNLGKGYAIANIHSLPQVRVIKFPLSMSGVFEGSI